MVCKMEAIRTYIDNIFKAFPQNERVNTLKRDMLSGMEEKYHELKNSGKSEHEAVGSVISDFGNADEIAIELEIEAIENVEVNATKTATPTASDSSISLSHAEAYSFIKQMKKSSAWIGAGVWLIMTGIAVMLLISNATIKPEYPFSNESLLSATGIFVFLAFVAGAVSIFIVHGMTLSKFEEYETTTLILDSATRMELEDERKRYMPKFTGFIAGGVAVILLSVGVFVLLMGASIFDGSELIPVALLLFSIGFAVLMFVNAGMTHEAYEILLGVGDYAGKEKAKKVGNIIGTIASIYWPIMTAGYLLWSFAWDSWHISWLIWPIAGILFGALSAVVNACSENQE
jgi:hypothetical protein